MIIGISGKKGSGKDLVAEIIQYLTSPNVHSKGTFLECQEYGYVYDTVFETRRFADKLKDMVCILIGCTREQLEDREFKEKELGDEWTIFHPNFVTYDAMVSYALLEGISVDDFINEGKYELIKDGVYRATFMDKKLTPRKILQLLGTDGVRNIIHPDAWVNALMSEYTKYQRYERGTEIIGVKNESTGEIYPTEITNVEWDLPNWLIPDLRFPNELKAIEDRKGITIRIERPDLPEDSHPSETALDDAEFDYIIENSGTIEDLIEMVEDLLRNEKIIK